MIRDGSPIAMSAYGGASDSLSRRCTSRVPEPRPPTETQEVGGTSRDRRTLALERASSDRLGHFRNRRVRGLAGHRRVPIHRRTRRHRAPDRSTTSRPDRLRARNPRRTRRIRVRAPDGRHPKSPESPLVLGRFAGERQRCRRTLIGGEFHPDLPSISTVKFRPKRPDDGERRPSLSIFRERFLKQGSA